MSKGTYRDGLDDGQQVGLFIAYRIIKAEKKLHTYNSGAGRVLKLLEEKLKKQVNKDLFSQREAEIRKDTARIIHNNLDHYFNIIERIQPGYIGDTMIDIRSLQRFLCDFRNELESGTADTTGENS